MIPVTALDTPPNIQQLLTEQLKHTPHFQMCARTWWSAATDLPNDTAVYPKWVSRGNDLETILEIATRSPGLVLDAQQRGATFEMVPVASVKIMDSSLDRKGNFETKPCDSTWFVLISRADQSDLANAEMPKGNG